jgi:GntR family transcriptional regulator, histidine utilization repressor
MSGTSQTRAPEPTLHTRILSDIRQRILSGRWRPGHRIPIEHELSETYACSRMTVNKALSELARIGLIERRRKAGSFVSMPPRAQSALLDIRDLKDEVEALGLTYSVERLARQRRLATASDRRRLGLFNSVEIVNVTCRHFGADRPYCLEDRIINLAVVSAAQDEPFQAIAPGSWLVAHVPWTGAEHRITAASADARTARLLAIPLAAACLVVERITWRGVEPVTQVRFVYPGAVRELIARFEPSRGAAPAGTSDRQRVTRLTRHTAGPRAHDEQSLKQSPQHRPKQRSKQQGKKIL